ncbi:hypothetical protein GBF35_25905 [Nonomuraea phyllanthi]|uniref:hypothetical protein n=1 Tax=Nonomuraea phyllanthi TaxID=2219224 RepID=UPI00129369B6|nr:hypothetical protein [Nonomuraea phyllanthi]QFY09630.1 hypothetical protein GBF35_25905 [Nonomuraea phyllanthi]
MATILEDFEDDAFNLTIEGDWARDNEYAAPGGSWSLKSAPITGEQTSEVAVTVPPQATSLTFYYRVSSEEDYDVFSVLIDGLDQEITPNSGEVEWTPATLDVTGASEVTFLYTKDISVNAGDDAAWVDQIEFTVPDTGTPVAASDTAALTEMASVVAAPEAGKASSDSGHLVELRWRGEPQGGTPPSIRSTATAASGESSYIIGAPDGVAEDDVLIGIQAADRGSTANMTTPTGGATWQPLDSLDATSDLGVTQAIRVWWKRAGSVEPGLYTFNQASGSDGVCLVIAIKDASQSAAPKITRSTDGTGPNITTPGITPSSENDVELRIVAAYSLGTAITFTAPDGLTPLNSIQSRIYTAMAAAVRTLNTSSPTDPADFIASPDDSADWRAGYTVAIAPAVTGPPQVDKAASDVAAVVESATTIVMPDGEHVAADDTATLTETAAATADVTTSDMAALVEAATIEAGPGGVDQAALAETSMLQQAWSGDDQALLIDTGQVDAQVVAVDAGELTELVDVAKTIGPVSNDVAALSEAVTVAAEAAAADAGALAEMSRLEIGREVTDQALLAETVQVDARASGVDAGALAEAVDISRTIGPLANDGATLSASAAVDAQLAAADTGALTETAVAAVVKQAGDSGQLAEQVSVGLDAADAAALVETAAVDAAIATSDSAALTDSASLVMPKFAADAAALVEHSEVIDIGRAIVGAELIRRGWSAHSPRRRWAAGKPRRAWRADSPHT